MDSELKCGDYTLKADEWTHTVVLGVIGTARLIKKSYSPNLEGKQS